MDFLGWILRSWVGVMSFLDWLWSARRTDSVKELPRVRSGATKPAHTGSSGRLLKLEELGERELLPGIPNDITLDLISTKLNWRDFHVLSSVSPGWRKAIKDHKVYDSRVRAHSAETLLMVVSAEISGSFFRKEVYSIGLYSMRDKSWFQNLPPIPNMHRGIPSFSKCISLDGKIYVLGGREDKWPHAGCTRKVHVLDLAGLQMHWKECASLHDSRLGLGCDVIDGKIYVFGGSWLDKLVRGAEVYDPNVNVWSRIDQGRMSPSFNGRQDAVGDGIFLDGGLVCGAEVYDPNVNVGSRIEPGRMSPSFNDGGDLHQTVSKVYRQVSHWQDERWLIKTVFILQGKVHRLENLHIYVRDSHAHSWTFLQSYSFGPRQFGPNVSVSPPCAMLAVGDELLLAATSYNRQTKSYGLLVLQSKGLGRKDATMDWQIPKPFPSQGGSTFWSSVSC